uniref:Uncharacterized protein n=1 Tax=Anopheles gambiae TaxID=7165 RepID=A0A1S4GWS9_ANOGA
MERMTMVDSLLKLDLNVKLGNHIGSNCFQLIIYHHPPESFSGSRMKKDDKITKDKMMDRKVRHPTASFSTKSIIMNLVIAFFLYLLRRTIGLYYYTFARAIPVPPLIQLNVMINFTFFLEAGGKSAITKYSKFIK